MHLDPPDGRREIRPHRPDPGKHGSQARDGGPGRRLDPRRTELGHVVESLVVARRQIPPRHRRADPGGKLDVGQLGARHLAIVQHRKDARGRRGRPPAVRLRKSAGREQRHDNGDQARRPRLDPGRDRVHGHLVRIEDVQVVVRIEVVGGVVGIRRPPREELLADGDIDGRPAEGRGPLAEAQDAPVAIRVGNVEIDPVRVAVRVAPHFPDGLHANPRANCLVHSRRRMPSSRYSRSSAGASWK